MGANDSVYFSDNPDTVWLAGNTANGFSLGNANGYFSIAGFGSGDNNAFFNGGNTVFYCDTNAIGTESACQAAIIVQNCTGATVYGGKYWMTDSITATPTDRDKPTRMGIGIGGTTGSLLTNLEIDINGFQVIGIYGTYHTEDTIRDVRIWNRSWRYLDRQSYTNGGVQLWQGPSPSGTDYDIILEHVVVEQTHHGGIDLSYNRSHVINCSTYVAGRNVYWDTAACFSTGTCETGQSSENSYGLRLDIPQSGTRVDGFNSVPLDGVNGRGGRVMLIDGAQGTETSPIVARHVTGWSYNGPSGETSSKYGAGRGIRIRQYDANTWDYVELVACTVYTKADNLSGTIDIGLACSPLEVTAQEQAFQMGHLTIDSSLFVAYAMTTGVDAAGGYIGQIDSLGGLVHGRNIQVHNTKFVSGDVVFQFKDEGNNVGGTNVDLLDCTFALENTIGVIDSGLTFGVGGLYFGGQGNRVVNGTFLAGASDTSLLFASDTPEGSIFIDRVLNIEVEDASGSPCVGCSVLVWNAYAPDTTDTRSGTVVSGVTGEDGILRDTVTYWYESKLTADSTAFNDFRIKALSSGGADSASVVYTVSATTYEPIVGLPEYDAHRVSIIFVHYSVGTQLLEGYCWSGTTPNIIDDLDTMNWTDSTGNDTARIVFRSYKMNNEGSTTSLSDTIPGTGENGCAFDYSYYTGFEYRLYEGGLNGRVDILEKNEGVTCPDATCDASILTDFFKTSWSGTDYGKLFETHNVPSRFGDSTVEEGGYDLVCIKNPYRCWFDINSTQVSLIKGFYQELFDTLENHPEIRYGSAFGTPLLAGHNWTDSTDGKLCYALYQWWLDTLVAPSNVYKIDTYGPLLEMDEVGSRYCLDSALWDAQDGSHINSLGRAAVRSNLLSAFQLAVEDIMDERFGGAGAPVADSILLNKSSMSFSATEDGSLPLSQTFSITNHGENLLDFSISDGGAAWLDQSPSSGNSNSQTVTVSINTTALTPGTYNATITISSVAAANSPQTILVSYVVSESQIGPPRRVKFRR